MATKTPRVPIQTPAFDGEPAWERHWTRTWIIFFEKMLQRGDAALAAQQDKVTFGLVKTLAVGQGLTLYYICRKAGTFIDFTAKIKDQPPSGANAILDVVKSTNDGASWASLFPSGNPNKIVLPAGLAALVTVSVFATPPANSVDAGDLLRIDCLQIGSTDPGKGIEVVGRFQ